MLWQHLPWLAGALGGIGGGGTASAKGGAWGGVELNIQDFEPTIWG